MRSTRFGRTIRSVLSLASVLFVGLAAACGGEADDADVGERTEELPRSTGQTASALLPTNGSGCDPAAAAGAGVVSTSMPLSVGTFSVTIRVTPELESRVRPPVLDAVIGLSSGAATQLDDLGPAVRFDGTGKIEARDGAVYRSDESFPYTSGRGAYELRMDVDVSAHTYSVWVRHLDAVAKPLVQLATHYAFVDTQQSLSQLDTVNRWIDGARGAVTTCGFSYVSTSPAPLAPVAFPVRIADWRAVSPLLAHLDD